MSSELGLSFARESIPQGKGKIMNEKFDLKDFRDQLVSIGKMGSMRSLLEMMPGQLGQMMPEDADPDDEVKRISAMLDSMTTTERADPDVIDSTRRSRIAKGAGVEHHEINKLIKQFDQMRGVMKQMSR